MSHTSTSSSDGQPVAGPGPKVLSSFKPVEAEIYPRATQSWLRWGVAVLCVFAAEFVARAVVNLDIVEPPVKYTMLHMDVKRDVFQDLYLPAEEEGTRYLVMGSSIAHTNIAPNIVSRGLEEQTGQQWTGFNGALYGIRYDDMIFFAQWYYDQWPYEHMLVPFDPWGARRERMPLLQERLGKPVWERWLLDHSALMRLRGQFRLWDTASDTRIRGLRQLDANDTMYGWARTIMQLAPYRDLPELQAQRQAELMIDSSLDPPQPFVPTVKLMEELRDWGIEHDVEMWWVLPPYTPELQEYLLPQFRHDAMRDLLRSVIDGYPKQHMIDLTYLEEEFPAKYYFDANHMSPYGARVYSERLGEVWGKRLVGDEVEVEVEKEDGDSGEQ